MDDYQKQVVEERVELDLKISKLDKFIDESPIFQKLLINEQDLLRMQLEAMTTYSDILYRRIKLFPL